MHFSFLGFFIRLRFVYVNRNLAFVYRPCGLEKKRMYAERVEQVEDGSFTPMVMSSTGGMGPEMSAS